MKNVTFTQQSIDLLNNHYESTTLSTGGLNFIPKAWTEQPSLAIVNHIKNRFELLPMATTCQGLLNELSGLSTLLGDSFPEQSEAVAETIALLTPKVKDKNGPNLRDLLLPKSQVEDVIASLPRPTQKVVAWLAVSTGVSPQDLLRDEFKLEKIREGVIQVGPKTGRKQTMSRRVEFDPEPLLELDPDGEITDLLNGVVFDGTGVGMVSANYFNGMLKDCPYNFYTLRASFAVHQRQEGITWADIALKMGVTDVVGLAERITRQAKANGIDLN